MIHLVTGKGGVGKSLVAAALAKSLSAKGRKTLLVELGERSYLRHLFQIPVGPAATPAEANLWLTRWEGESCLREYLLYLLKIERVVKMFFDNKVMHALVQAAPALKELALLGKITSGYRHVGPPLEYDEIVVDCFATGHFRALWRAPIGLAEAIPFGPMGEQSRSIVAVLKDPARTKYYVCMFPEELPVTEGLELARDIERELGSQARLIYNRVLESDLTNAQLEAYRGQGFADYLATLLNRQAELERVLTESGFEMTKLPWVFAQGAPEKVLPLAKRLETAGA